MTTKKQSCLIIAGEKSGEDHAKTFFPQLKAQLPDCEFFGVGGKVLEKEGVELLYNLTEFSSIGISEVLSKVPFYYRALDHILDEVKKRDCKTAILVDFQGFNLKITEKLKKMGVNVLYYVAPQAWVWKPWRAKTLQKNVHTLFTILPFEKKWFADRGVEKVRGVVHPLKIEYATQLENIRSRKYSDMKGRKPRLLFLPGSRSKEVETLLPIFKKAADILLEEGFDLEIGLATVDSVRPELYNVEGLSLDHSWDSTKLEDAFNWADLCFAASGTVTLATGLFEIPAVVAYKLSLFTEFVLRMLVPYDGPVSLTNIILDEYVYPELVQYQADRYNLAKFGRELLTNETHYDEVIGKLAKTKNLLSGDDFSVPDYMASVIRS